MRKPCCFEGCISLRRLMQNTFTLRERPERARTSAIILRAPSPSVAPTPIDPSAPAFETAAAIAGEDTPAIGA